MHYLHRESKMNFSVQRNMNIDDAREKYVNDKKTINNFVFIIFCFNIKFEYFNFRS